MKLQHSVLLLAGLSAMAHAASPAAAALNGCWRSQQTQTTLADGTKVNTNGDCTLEFTAEGVSRSRCYNVAGDSDIQYRVELIAPGRLRSTIVSSSPAKASPPGTVLETRYAVEGDWLLVEREGISPTAAGRQPIGFKSVSVRVPGKAGEDCRPRGANALRVGNTPSSSLDLTVPAGWQPWLVDPAQNKPLAAALRPSFLIGAFVPRGSDSTPPRLSVIVTDDTRPGPAQVTAAIFSDVQRMFLSNMPEPRIPCDPPGSACGLIRQEGKLIYTELVNAKGRVAIVTGVIAGTSATAQDEVRRAVRLFAEGVRRDNAR